MSRHSFTGLVAAMCAGLAACTAQAESWDADGVLVEVVSSSGQPFQQFPVRAESGQTIRAYLQAERGALYRVRVRNQTAERVAVVIAVDGRNIISGGRSDLARGESKYVIEPWETQEYAGWRTSLSEIHAFYFTDWNDSYAEAFGDHSARGVISVAVYREREIERARRREIEDRDRRLERSASADSAHASPPAPSSNAAGARASEKQSRDAAPGTGFGERHYDAAQYVAFQAESYPAQKIFLKYEWAETLCNRGISCDGRYASRDNRFWPEHRGREFAPYPPYRR